MDRTSGVTSKWASTRPSLAVLAQRARKTKPSRRGGANVSAKLGRSSSARRITSICCARMSTGSPVESRWTRPPDQQACAVQWSR
eukprot:3361509-Pyramimonas_sp.AAC.1